MPAPKKTTKKATAEKAKPAPKKETAKKTPEKKVEKKTTEKKPGKRKPSAKPVIERVEYIEVYFYKEKETKNTVRFTEDADEGNELIRTLYLGKTAVASLGNPEYLVVSIENADDVEWENEDEEALDNEDAENEEGEDEDE